MKAQGQLVNLLGLAALWGVHRNTVSSWVKRGCPYVTKADRNQGIEWEFDSAEVAQWRLEKAVQDAIGDTQSAGDAELRRRKLAAETVIAELEAAKARGQVGDLEEFERQMVNAAVEIRTLMQQMVSRVAPMVLGLKEEGEIKAILAEEIDQALTVISNELGNS